MSGRRQAGIPKLASGQVYRPARPGFLWEMSNNSDTGERKGHKRKLADALTPQGTCSTEPSTTGEEEPILSQVRRTILLAFSNLTISEVNLPIGASVSSGMPACGGDKDLHVEAAR